MDSRDDGAFCARVDEETPLLLGDSIPPGRITRSFCRDLLFNPEETSGVENAHQLVWLPALVWHVAKVALLSSWMRILLVFVPLGAVAGERQWDSVSVFTLNFLAMIPVAAILSFATEELSHCLGETLGRLVNATFGNAVELIVTIVALQANQIEIVQGVSPRFHAFQHALGARYCFFLGGIFNIQTCSLMALASASTVIPTTLYGGVIYPGLSRGISVIPLLLYCLYLYFALHTHKHLFKPQDQVPVPEPSNPTIMLSPLSSIIILFVTTVIISYSAGYMVGSIDDLVKTANLSKKFIGLILIPIVGNTAEHATACVVAIKDKMDLAMAVAIRFETVAFATSVIVVVCTVQDG
ncbi:calcium/proton exchanger [Apodospora peruviana]|uniref:Vacuolar calcium ion transporter n=1 Tax=Apodospora peruviana TaxID=516989 RepID=A0AAE0I1T2_9PEZI|nr:calcium/proton exchanger [Apodospora peruviana]